MKKVFSILFWAFVALTSALCFVVAVAIWIVTTPFDRQRRINHLWSCAWASIYAIAYPGWRVRTIHRDRIQGGKAYVLCANHTSVADIVLLFTLFRQYKWVSKRSNFNIPLIGWNMRLSGYVPLVRGDASSTKTMLDACRKLLLGGMSIMMFPEGTRSKDGNVQPFKHGAFTLAQETRADVVPIAIHGGHALIPKHGAAFATTADLVVEVLEPIPYDAYPSAAELGEACRERIVAAVGRPADNEAASPSLLDRPPSLPKHSLED